MPADFDRYEWCDLIASEHGPPDPSTRLVLFVLSLHMNRQGENAFPSQKKIAVRSALSERSVRTHLDHAVKGGWLRISQKPRKSGHAWFVHEYTPTIPEALIDHCAGKPWEQDPTWQRPADSAGSSNRQGSQAPREPLPKTNPQHPANYTEQAATVAQQAANGDRTPGKIFRNTRQGLPTNSSMNPSMNTPHERAALSRGTTVQGNLNSKSAETKASRREKAKQLLDATPDFPIEKVADIYGLTTIEVQELRKMA